MLLTQRELLTCSVLYVYGQSLITYYIYVVVSSYIVGDALVMVVLMCYSRLSILFVVYAYKLIDKSC